MVDTEKLLEWLYMEPGDFISLSYNEETKRYSLLDIEGGHYEFGLIMKGNEIDDFDDLVMYRDGKKIRI